VVLSGQNHSLSPRLFVADYPRTMQAKGNYSAVTRGGRNEHFITSIVFHGKCFISLRFFGSVRKMSECFGQSTNELVSDRINENHREMDSR
jgi:hypothetical protein